MVKVPLNGQHEAVRVELQADALSQDNEFLEDLIGAAINDPPQKLEAVSQEKMSQLTGGMSLPPGMNFGL